MSSVLVRIKRAVLAGRYVFSDKARLEMDVDDLTDRDVIEAIVNATTITKTMRSTSPFRAGPREMLYVILSNNLNGVPIYTKGKLVHELGADTFYFLISSKKAL